MARYGATGRRSWSSRHHALLAETHQMVGDADTALRILTDALDLTERTGEKWYAAEIHRRMGDAHRQRGGDDAAARCFEKALIVARCQSAKLWELQAATSYAHLLADRGTPSEGRARLARVYDWFTEGFDTVPLHAARMALDGKWT